MAACRQGAASSSRPSLRVERGFEKSDRGLFSRRSSTDAIGTARQLEAHITPSLDRKFAVLSSRSSAIRRSRPTSSARAGCPYRVVINEAVELAKTYGGTDGHKYVNGVLDKLASQLREHARQARAEHKGADLTPQMDPRLSKRILMFYFAAGINIVVGLYKWSIDGGSRSDFGRHAGAHRSSSSLSGTSISISPKC